MIILSKLVWRINYECNMHTMKKSFEDRICCALIINPKKKLYYTFRKKEYIESNLLEFLFSLTEMKVG